MGLERGIKVGVIGARMGKMGVLYTFGNSVSVGRDGELGGWSTGKHGDI
jgi:hypothetical protein